MSSLLQPHPKVTRLQYLRHERVCVNCKSKRLHPDDNNSDYVCLDCGRMQNESIFDTDPGWNIFHWAKENNYKRVFYFNEKCTRWLCTEPSIHPVIWQLIEEEARKPTWREEIKACTRKTISQILRSVNIPNEVQYDFQSTKFKRRRLDNKRLYDKYYEKWKTIRWRLTKRHPIIPPHNLVTRMKQLFIASERRFESIRHDAKCDGRHKCEQYFNCLHNFLNYDFLFLKFLQIIEITERQPGLYDVYKHDFHMVSKKIRDSKLRPLFKKICQYNGWPCLDYE